MAVKVAFISETERILATYVTITISIGKTLGDVIVQLTFEPSELKVARPLSQLSKYYRPNSPPVKGNSTLYERKKNMGLQKELAIGKRDRENLQPFLLHRSKYFLWPVSPSTFVFWSPVCNLLGFSIIFVLFEYDRTTFV